MPAVPSSLPLFAVPALCQARELRREEVPALQAFFDANPEYFQTVNGRPARPDEAAQEFDELPPAHLGFGRRWMLGLFDARGAAASGELLGLALVLSDFTAPGVWHVALFMLGSALHGRGLGARTYAALEAWMAGQGAQWSRLGVVQGNAKAERFWARQGYLEARQRPGVDTGGRVNTLRVCVKPLRPGASLADYLRLVPRDHPASTQA